jgi:hypothetical protein
MIPEELIFGLGPALVLVLVLSAPTPRNRRQLGSHRRIGFNLWLKVDLGTGNRLDVFQLLEDAAIERHSHRRWRHWLGQKNSARAAARHSTH